MRKGQRAGSTAGAIDPGRNCRPLQERSLCGRDQRDVQKGPKLQIREYETVLKYTSFIFFLEECWLLPAEGAPHPASPDPEAAWTQRLPGRGGGARFSPVVPPHGARKGGGLPLSSLASSLSVGDLWDRRHRAVIAHFLLGIVHFPPIPPLP